MTYVIEFHCYVDAVEQLKYPAELDSLHTVLDKLFLFASTYWVKIASKICQQDRQPCFRDLCEVVPAEARLYRNRYSRLIGGQNQILTRD